MHFLRILHLLVPTLLIGRIILSKKNPKKVWGKIIPILNLQEKICLENNIKFEDQELEVLVEGEKKVGGFAGENNEGEIHYSEVEITNISKIIDPSSEQIDSEGKQKKGLGFFGYFFLLIVITLSIVGVLKVFQNELLMYFPRAQYIYDKAEYIFETFDNMIIIIQDLINFY